MARLTRWLLVRDPQNDRAGVTVESAAEHEMLAMVAAARAGGRVPEPVVAYPVAGGPGPPGALVAWIDVGGRRLDLLVSRPGDRGSTRRSVAQRGPPAPASPRPPPTPHRTTSLIDGSDQAWLTGLVVAELGATDRQLATDVAELLASLAVQIGVDRTVASAVARTGRAHRGGGRRLPATAGGVLRPGRPSGTTTTGGP